jgi:uncharacterized protein YfaP (DUF2135 family)
MLVTARASLGLLRICWRKPAYAEARITLAITWPQGVINEEDTQTGAAQVNGGVREWQERQVQLVVTPSRSPSP